MNTETLILLIFFFIVIVLFIVGMFLVPELFGISKKPDSSEADSRNNDVK